MHVGSNTQSEIAITIDVALEMANALAAGEFDTRAMLTDAGFSRAPSASEASVERVTRRLVELRPILDRLAEGGSDSPPTDSPPNDSPPNDSATRQLNEQLTELPVAPAIAVHDGSGPHMHWTPASATFDDQVITDILMALAQEICEHDTLRFGRCGAADCSNLFFDQTRNHSRRFCSDSRCASRTHTADHRARRKSAN